MGLPFSTVNRVMGAIDPTIAGARQSICKVKLSAKWDRLKSETKCNVATRARCLAMLEVAAEFVCLAWCVRAGRKVIARDGAVFSEFVIWIEAHVLDWCAGTSITKRLGLGRGAAIFFGMRQG